MEMGDNLFFRGNATSVILNVMIFKLNKRGLTGLRYLYHLTMFGDTERGKCIIRFRISLRISIFGLLGFINNC